jgi:hypothetical protein
MFIDKYGTYVLDLQIFPGAIIVLNLNFIAVGAFNFSP